jgi:SprB repeat/Secretion system C-terminal sorting domain
MKVLFSILFCGLLSYSAKAQLNDGTTAPNWTMSDINGTTHTLYDDLNLGKAVVLDFSAAYCPTCWGYHNTHALKDFYTSRGPNATIPQANVYFIEMIASNTTGCLYGAGGGGTPYQACNGSSAGNWVAGTPYPIIDNASQNTAYNINYYPTVYMVCPNKKVYLVGQQTAAQLDNSMQTLCGITPGVAGAAPLVYQNNSTNNPCFGDKKGTIALTVTGGVPPYSYVWNNASTSATINNLAAGSYQATITDSQNKTLITSAITITQASQINVTASVKPYEKCGNAGTIDLTVSGGTGAYSYQWSSNTPPAFTSAGTYSTTVTDALGCTAVKSVTMTGFDNQPTATVNTNLTLTCAVPKEQLNATILPQSNFYTSSWTSSNGGNILSQTSNTATVNAAGSYTFKVTDSRSKCSATSVVAVIENKIPPTILFPPTTATTLTCKTPELSLAPTITNAGNAPTFLWTGGTLVAGQNTASATINTAGMYQLDVLNTVNGCHAISPAISISEDKLMPSIVFSPSIATTLTCKTPELILAPTITNAGNTSTFHWIGGTLVAGQNTASATINTDGFYQLDVLNTANGCHTSSIILYITEDKEMPSISFLPSSATILTCKIPELTLAPTIAHAGDMPTFHWTGGTFVAGQNTAAATVNSAGTYKLDVTNPFNGCHASSSFTISEAIKPNVSLQGTTLKCFGDKTGTILIQTGNTKLPITYHWSNGETSSNAHNLAAGAYSVTITDAYSCTASNHAEVTEPSHLAIHSENIIPAIGTTSTGSISVSVSGGTSPYTYSWTHANTQIGTEKELKNVPAGDYSLLVTDANGCTLHSAVYTVKSLTDIEEVTGLTYFNYSPNPTNSNVKITLQLTEPQMISVNLIDALGKIIETKSSIFTSVYDTEFEVPSLPPAIYLLQIVVGQKQWVEKVVKY